MGRIVAISSGHMDDLYSIHAYIVDGSKKKHVLFIPTASENSESYIQSIEEGYGLVKGLNLHEYIYCPHYEERVDSFNHMMQGKSVPGLALETNTAFVENNGDIWFISTDSSKNVYTIKEGKKVKEKIWKL